MLGSATLGRKGSSGLSSVPSSGYSSGYTSALSGGLGSGLSSGLGSGLSSGLGSGLSSGGGASAYSSGIPKWSSPVKTDGMLSSQLGGDVMTRSTLVRQRVWTFFFIFSSSRNPD